MTRRARTGTGKVFEKVIKLLADEGFEVRPDDIWTQQGANRHRYMDLAVWGGTCRRGDTIVHFASWDTMTDCAKYGIDVSPDDTPHYEISMKPGKVYK